MIEKLKAYLEVVKGALLFIVTPIVFLVGGIYYLIAQNTSLKDKLGQSEAEKHLAKILTEKEEAKNEANSKEDDYNTLRNKYVHDHDDGGPKAS